MEVTCDSARIDEVSHFINLVVECLPLVPILSHPRKYKRLVVGVLFPMEQRASCSPATEICNFQELI